MNVTTSNIGIFSNILTFTRSLKIPLILQKKICILLNNLNYFKLILILFYSTVTCLKLYRAVFHFYFTVLLHTWNCTELYFISILQHCTYGNCTELNCISILQYCSSWKCTKLNCISILQYCYILEIEHNWIFFLFNSTVHLEIVPNWISFLFYSTVNLESVASWILFLFYSTLQL